MALPALVLVTVAASWGVTVAAAQVACVDAVRMGARAAARGERDAAVRAAVRAAAPPGAHVEVRRGAGTARVAVTAVIRAPVLSGLPPITLREQAHAVTESEAPGQ